MWLRFWNPATRTISKKLGSCRVDGLVHYSNLKFGYDSSTDIYKVVYFLPETTNVRIFNLGDNVWRNIQNSPVTSRGFQEMPFVIPNLSVLKDCLCFCHDFKQTRFVIWQMKEFRVEESWTQFLKISYHNLQIDNNFNYLNFYVSTIRLSEKNDTLLLKTSCESSAILYNWRDKSIKRIKKSWWFNVQDYVESLVTLLFMAARLEVVGKLTTKHL
nr:F-box protein interaction domain [Medicago truncatula]